ncbi:MAG: PD-(D/E)XK nuclease-like domain-containing protein [Solirubrobacterales bacterium]|nr:PD-(D/E)XK nuclease-like domain-containing protein [Solirubrobacterales bacterium]
MTLAAGIHALGADDYHADPCERPSLSAHIAHALVSASPLHAWTQHPRNPNFQPREETRFDIGTAAHQLLLEGRSFVVELDFPDFKTVAAREARDAVRAAGLLPLLAKDAATVDAMVKAAVQQLALVDAQPPLLTDGKPEQTLVWEDEGVLCRARLDWLRDDLRAIDDLKTTAGSASPEMWSRRLFDIGADMQVAFYRRAVRALTGAEPDFRFVVIETHPPYALSVVSLGVDALALAERKVQRAITLWRECLEANDWPGYPTQVAYAQLPAWEEARWMERQETAA